jgi:hypothetical protein
LKPDLWVAPLVQEVNYKVNKREIRSNDDDYDNDDDDIIIIII